MLTLAPKGKLFLVSFAIVVCFCIFACPTFYQNKNTMADKFPSYWTVRRHIRANVLRHMETNTSESDSNEEVHVYEAQEPAFAPAGHVLQNQVTDSDSESVNQVSESENEHVSQDLMVSDSDNETTSDVERLCDFHNTFSSDDDSDDDSESETTASEMLPEKLREWAVKFQVSHMSLSELLLILKPLHPNLPKDPRTLMKTKTNYEIVNICGGEYYHFGLASSLVNKLSSCLDLLPDLSQLELQVNIDGLPLFKSTNDQLWPILGRILNVSDGSPFVIGLYSGQSKPNNLDEYLRNFIDDFRTTFDNGIEYSGKHFTIHLDSVICDTPARAFVKCVKSHSGYHGCDKCEQRGLWQNKMTFPETNAALRTDAAFDAMTDTDHHTGRSPFVDLSLGMVSQFPLDYMHLVCLGVMKRLLLIWMKGPLNTRLGPRVIRQISTSLVNLRENVPSDFSRKPRSLFEIDRWKATELRQFLLYTGPVVLNGLIHPNMYDNFMLLSVAMHLLLNEKLSNTYFQYASELMVAFVTHFYQIYGRDMAVYNVHGLVHLSGEAQQYGSLDNISSFPFENYLHKLKKMIRKPKFPLSQVIRRLSEETIKVREMKAYPVLKMEHNRGPIPHILSDGIQFRVVETESLCYKLNIKDNCVKIDGRIGLIENIIYHDGEVFFCVRYFRQTADFFTVPIMSHFLGIFKVWGLERNVTITKITDVEAKCVLLPRRDKYVAIPFTDAIW